MEFRFADPWLLLLALGAVLALVRRPRRGGAEFGAYPLARLALTPSRGPALHRLLIAAGLAAFAIAAARPQYGRTVVERAESGRDLMLVLDLSPSMTADDMVDRDGRRCDRLKAVMAAAIDFVARRPNDRIGLVFFARTAMTSCPLTYDHETVRAFIERTERQQRALWGEGHKGLLSDGTNIGLGLGAALRAVQDPLSKGRALVLITDGIDTRQLPNWVDPLIAARHAATKKVTIHALGVGNADGTISSNDPFGGMHLQRVPRDLLPDLGRLREISGLTGGVAAIAGDAQELDALLAKIDALEETERSVPTREDYADRFHWPLVIGLALLALACFAEPRLRGVA